MPRTTKPAGGGKRHPLNMRTTRETRDRLEAAAAANGRSLAQEVEARLERSFAEEAGFGGPEMRNVAYLMASAFALNGQHSAAGKPNWIAEKEFYLAGVVGAANALLQARPDVTDQDAARTIEALKIRLLSRIASQEEQRK
jgi:hypothetical protein